MHPSETEASYAKRIYNSVQHTLPVVVVNQKQTIFTPLKLDLSAKKPIEGGVWTNIQTKKINEVAPQVLAYVAKKTVNSFSAIDNGSEHIVANVKAENLFEHLDEWGDDDVKDIKLTVDYGMTYAGAKVYEPNIGFYQDVKVKDF